MIEQIRTPKTSANFSFDRVNGIFDRCNRNVPSSSSLLSKIFNEEDGVLWKRKQQIEVREKLFDHDITVRADVFGR